MMSFIYIIPTFFTGVFGDAYSSNAVGQIMPFVPTYYLAQGVFNAMQSRATASSLALDIAVVAGCTVALFAAAVWALRRQAAVVGAL
jgi:ABC-2 type transport system permease protein